MDPLIDDALRSDGREGPRTAYFRYGVMRRIRDEVDTPRLRFPWRLVAVAGIVGAVGGAVLSAPLHELSFGAFLLIAMAAAVPLHAAAS